MTCKETTVRGERRWLVDLRRQGKGRRAFFRSKAAAQKFAQDAVTGRSILKAEWEGLSPSQQREVLTALADCHKAGLSLVEVVRTQISAQAPPKAIGEALEEFLEAKKLAGRRDAYTRHLRLILKDLMRGREKDQLANFTPADVEAFLHRPGYAASAREGMQRRVTTFFSWCLKRGWLKRSPCAALEKIQVAHGVPKIFSAAQAEALLRAAETQDAGLVPWLVIGMFCGVRPHELARMDREAVKLSRGFVEVTAAASKVHMRRLVMLQPNARAWLTRYDGELQPANLRKRLEKVRELAGIEEWPADVLRHTAASYLLGLVKDTAAVALQLGNSPQILFRHYRELVAPEDVKKFWALQPMASVAAHSAAR